MKLYGSLVSPYVARVAFAARLKGLTLIPELPPGGIKSAEFLHLNPIGKMPAMEVDGRPLAESMVLLDYLEDAYPTPALLPASAYERAQSRLLGRIVDLYVTVQARYFFTNMNPATRKADEVAAGVLAYRKSLEQLEHFMGPGPYAVGSTLGYADVAMMPCLQMMASVAGACVVVDPYDGLPRLGSWWRKLQTDPVTVAFIDEYHNAFMNFMASRR